MDITEFIQSRSLMPYLSAGEAVRAGEAARITNLNSLMREIKAIMPATSNKTLLATLNGAKMGVKAAGSVMRAGAKTAGFGVGLLGKAATPLLLADSNLNTKLLQGDVLGAATDLGSAFAELGGYAVQGVIHFDDVAQSVAQFCTSGHALKDTQAFVGGMGQVLGTGVRHTTQGVHISIRNALGMDSYDETALKYLPQAVGAVKRLKIDEQTGDIEQKNNQFQYEDVFYRLSLDKNQINVYERDNLALKVDPEGVKLITTDDGARITMQIQKKEMFDANNNQIAFIEEVTKFDESKNSSLQERYGAKVGKGFKKLNPSIGQEQEIITKINYVKPDMDNFILFEQAGQTEIQIITPVVQTTTSKPIYVAGIKHKTEKKVETTYQKQSYALNEQEAQQIQHLLDACKTGEKTTDEAKQAVLALVADKDDIEHKRSFETKVSYSANYYSQKYQALRHRNKLSKNDINKYGLYIRKIEDFSNNKTFYYNEQGDLNVMAQYGYDESGCNQFAFALVCKKTQGKENAPQQIVDGKGQLIDIASKEHLGTVKSVEAGGDQMALSYLKTTVPGYEGVKYNYYEKPNTLIQHSKQLSSAREDAVLIYDKRDNQVIVSKMLRVNKETGVIKEFDENGCFKSLLMPDGSNRYINNAELAAVVVDVPHFEMDNALKQEMIAQNRHSLSPASATHQDFAYGFNGLLAESAQNTSLGGFLDKQACLDQSR